ncbi:MAG TPA: hypothetical protein VH372_06660 [Actinospica sp.]|jgi:hypothetical protein|nr:hypothetical protein [Actinospica sp.]
MAAEHTPAPAEHTGQREPATSGAVRGLAEAIAEQIAVQQAGDNTLSGSFDVEIVYGGIEYTLTVAAPNPTDIDPGHWSVVGTRKDLKTDKSIPFLTFEYTGPSNWTIGAGLPLPITFSNGLEINRLYGEFSMSGGSEFDAQDAED